MKRTSYDTFMYYTLRVMAVVTFACGITFVVAIAITS